MQATVLTFDPVDGSGSVVLDDGRALRFSGEAFRRSELRLVRPGQRMRLTVDAEGVVQALTIVTLADPLT
ncbi:MAG: hypothetical protein WKF82_09400 [Nocardioidaceae bacterium]